MNNKKRIITLTTLISTLSLGLCFAFNSNNINTQYIKSEAAMDVDGLEKITRSNLNTLVKGDMVYLITGSTNYGIGGESNFMKNTLANLNYFEVMDVTNEYEVSLRYTVNKKYIDVTKENTAVQISSNEATYLLIDEENHFTIYKNDKTYYFARNAANTLLGLLPYGSVSTYPSFDENCLFMFKDTTYTASLDDFNNNMINTLECDNSGVTPPGIEVWNDINNIYNKLSDGDKNILKTTDKDIEGNTTEQALAKYDFIINKYYKTGEYADFIGRVTNGKVVPDTLMFDMVTPSSGNSDRLMVTIITMVSVMTLVSLTGFFLVKRKNK